MLRRTPFAAAMLLLGSLQASPAAADSASAEIVNLVYTEIPVTSDGSSYIDLPPISAIQGFVHLKLDAGTSGKIKWVTTWWYFFNPETNPYGGWASYREDGFHKPFDPRPKSWEDTVLVSVPIASFKDQALDECNALADQLRDEGLSDQEIFSQNRIVQMGAALGLDFEMTGASGIPEYTEGDFSGDYYQSIKLVCRKWPGATPPLAAEAPSVKKATLNLIEQAGPANACKLVLSGVVETFAPNADFSFRYKDGAGHQSEVYELTSDHTRTSMFSHEYDIPVNPDGNESGKVRIVGVSDDFASPWAHYEMDCLAPSFEALLPPKLTMQVLPQKPHMFAGQYCPSEVKIVGKIEGRSEMSGEAIFFGDYYLSPPQAYEVQKGDVVLLGADRDLDWSDADLVQAGQVRKLTIQLGFNVTGPSDAIVASLPKKDYTFSCMIPSTDVQAGQGVMSGPPRPNPAPAAPRLRLAPRSLPGVGPGAGPDSGPATTPPTLRRPVLSVTPPAEPKAPRLRLQRERSRQRN